MVELFLVNLHDQYSIATGKYKLYKSNRVYRFNLSVNILVKWSSKAKLLPAGLFRYAGRNET